MTRRAWLRIPAVLLVPALGALTPLPRAVLLDVSARAESLCRAIGACDASAACGPAACTPCVPSSCGAQLGCLPVSEPSSATACGGDAAVPDDDVPAVPDGSPAPRGIVCLCVHCGQGVPTVSPEFEPPALAAVLSEAPPGVLVSVSREPSLPPPKTPPIVT